MTDKKKSSNFSAAEVGVLVDEVEMHKAVLFAKFGSNVSNSMKTKLWQDITEKVNAVGVGEVRSIDGVKKKWYVSLASLVLIHLLFHLSNHLCHLHHSQHPSLLHSFTPGSKHTFSTNPSHLNRLLVSLSTVFTDHWTYHTHRFAFSSFFC